MSKMTGIFAARKAGVNLVPRVKDPGYEVGPGSSTASYPVSFLRSGLHDYVDQGPFGCPTRAKPGQTPF